MLYCLLLLYTAAVSVLDTQNMNNIPGSLLEESLPVCHVQNK